MTGADATILGVATATGIPFTTLHRHLKRGGFTIPELYLIAEHLNIQVTDLMVTAAA